eukprot:9482893-Pyramimonas_sp.AAC.1
MQDKSASGRSPGPAKALRDTDTPSPNRRVLTNRWGWERWHRPSLDGTSKTTTGKSRRHGGGGVAQGFEEAEMPKACI